MKRSTLRGLVAGFCLLILPQALRSAEIVHIPLLNAAAGQDLIIEADITGKTGNSDVRLYYRQKGKELFKSKSMLGSTRVSAKIYGKDVQVGGVEYYIEVKGSGGSVTNPRTSPTIKPHYVSVRKDKGSPEITIMSPLEDEKLDTASPVITVAFDDDDSGINTKSVLLSIDGSNVTADAQVFETLLSYIPPTPLSQGTHHIKVVVKDGAGNTSEKSWSVTVDSSVSGKVEVTGADDWAWNGRVNYLTQYVATTNEPEVQPSSVPYRPKGVNRLRVNTTGRGPDSRVQLNVYKTDEERLDQQPVDRYTLSYRSDEGIVSVGDVASGLRFSDLTLSDIGYLRGFALDLRSGAMHEGHSRFMAVYGQTAREVDAGKAGLSSAPATPSFSQYLYGFRWEAFGKYFGMGFNGLTVNDKNRDTASKTGINPVNNWVLTSDMMVNIPPAYLKLNGEGGFSFYAADPTPFSSSLGLAYKFGADINVLPSGTRLEFEWRNMGGKFPFVSDVVPAGYNSLGNPGLINDYKGYESSFNQNLMDGQTQIGVSFNQWDDNLLGTKESTTTSTFLNLFLSVALDKLPYISAGYTTQGQKNDGTSNLSLTQTTGVVDYQTKNKTDSLNLNVGYTHIFSGTSTLNGNVSWVSTKFTDSARIRLSQDLDSTQLTLSSFLTVADTTGSIGWSSGKSTQPSYSFSEPGIAIAFNALESSNSDLNLRLSQAWVVSVFDTFVAFSTSNSETIDKANLFPGSGTRTDSRTTISLGSNWEPRVNHRLNLTLTQASTKTETAGVVPLPVDNEIAQFLTSASYNLTF